MHNEKPTTVRAEDLPGFLDVGRMWRVITPGEAEGRGELCELQFEYRVMPAFQPPNHGIFGCILIGVGQGEMGRSPSAGSRGDNFYEIFLLEMPPNIGKLAFSK